MRTFLLRVITILYLLISYLDNTPAQTPIYYQYDPAGNRKLRSITLSKLTTQSAKADSVVNTQSSKIDNKTLETFKDSLVGKKILIYPNPTQGQLNINIEGMQEGTKSSLYLYNLSGSLLINKTAVNGSSTIDLSNRPMGIYILEIIIDNKKTEWKIIKE